MGVGRLRDHRPALGFSGGPQRRTLRDPWLVTVLAVPGDDRRRHHRNRDGGSPLLRAHEEPGKRGNAHHRTGRHSAAAVEHRSALRWRLRARRWLPADWIGSAHWRPVRGAVGAAHVCDDPAGLPRTHVPNRADQQPRDD